MVKPLIINEFKDEYHFLSNFFIRPLVYMGLGFTNTEAAFQAQKTLSKVEHLPFSVMDPGPSKKAGRRLTMRPDWNNVRVGVMSEVIHAKFNQNPDLQQKLLDTGDAILIEGNNWNDKYWGMDLETSQGENMLGKILMAERSYWKIFHTLKDVSMKGQHA